MCSSVTVAPKVMSETLEPRTLCNV
jgi:hypothetical protein